MVGKGLCIDCHSGPNFSDWKFRNSAVRQAGENIGAEDVGRMGGVASVKGDEFNCASKWSDQADKASCAVAMLEVRDTELGAFRTPTLRECGTTGPYMHTA